MKLLFSFFLFCLISAQPLFAQDLSHRYSIKTKGINIGSLTWKLNITEDSYETYVELESKGFLSKLYKFAGKYSAAGTIKENTILPKRYTQNWETSNQKKYVELKFKNDMIERLTLNPKETELPRIKYKKMMNYKDPLSSLIGIMLTGAQSYTIDGRRAYLLYPEKKSNKILIKEYTNIWADHKRNDLEYLEVQKREGDVLPQKIIIKFKGSLFYLTKI